MSAVRMAMHALGWWVGIGLALCAWTPARADDASALRAAVAVEQARAPAPPLPREGLLAPPVVLAVQLSPDGRHVAWLRRSGEVRSLWLLPTAGGAPRRLLTRTGATQLRWSRDSRWLFLVGRDALAFVPLRGKGGLRVPLGGLEAREVAQLDPSQPCAVVLRERVRDASGERWRMVRLDATGKRTLLREDRRWIRELAFDGRGRVVALTRFDGDHDALYRVDAQGHLRRIRVLEPMARAELVGATGDGDLLLRGDTGGNFKRVLRLDREGGLHTVHEDPRGEADLDELTIDPATGEPLAASYRSIVPATYGIGIARERVAAIVAHFRGRDVGIQVGRGPGARWLVAERDATLREPRWHLFDPQRGTFVQVLDDEARASRPLPEAALARKIPVAYLASDGMRIHGFLLLPAGADPARVPLVAQVHGGPINHFDAGYDGLAQLLANHGYAVFQSNFRGSTGHGRDYMFASDGDYGNGRVQRDIVEGVRFLLAQGIGDPARVGIVGHSFGGYSTLVGLTFQPELFRVGVAGAPPADLAWSMNWLVRHGDQGDLPDRSLVQALRALELDPADPETYRRLHAQSPLVNAARMRRPLLILAGGADRVVAIREVANYAARLRLQGKPVSLYVEPGGGHSPTARLPIDAYAFLMLRMLHVHLGGRAPEAPGPDLLAWLRDNLRLAGPEFDGLGRKPLAAR